MSSRILPLILHFPAANCDKLLHIWQINTNDYVNRFFSLHAMRVRDTSDRRLEHLSPASCYFRCPLHSVIVGVMSVRLVAVYTMQLLAWSSLRRSFQQLHRRTATIASYKQRLTFPLNNNTDELHCIVFSYAVWCTFECAIAAETRCWICVGRHCLVCICLTFWVTL